MNPSKRSFKSSPQCSNCSSWSTTYFFRSNHRNITSPSEIIDGMNDKDLSQLYKLVIKSINFFPKIIISEGFPVKLRSESDTSSSSASLASSDVYKIWKWKKQMYYKLSLHQKCQQQIRQNLRKTFKLSIIHYTVLQKN